MGRKTRELFKAIFGVRSGSGGSAAGTNGKMLAEDEEPSSWAADHTSVACLGSRNLKGTLSWDGSQAGEEAAGM